MIDGKDIKPVLEKDDKIILGILDYEMPTLSFYSKVQEKDVKFEPLYYKLKENVSTDVALMLIFMENESVINRIQYFYHESTGKYPSISEFPKVQEQLNILPIRKAANND